MEERFEGIMLTVLKDEEFRKLKCDDVFKVLAEAQKEGCFDQFVKWLYSLGLRKQTMARVKQLVQDIQQRRIKLVCE